MKNQNNETPRNNTPINLIDAIRFGQVQNVPVRRNSYTDGEYNKSFTKAIITAALDVVSDTFDEVEEPAKKKSKKQ